MFYVNYSALALIIKTREFLITLNQRINEEDRNRRSDEEFYLPADGALAVSR